ncbi:hypothetical protein [Chryseobacterium shigense]|uniref:Uncharacterized protein n=1 Tax=Chryseobacterium shigense TaxID=297244 RepID=A0A841N8X9_9FLAO|nr:hypothetical protein [Chryseobacterium shigense]MBB6371533.1 hypothetical protein [Chryseobacterium shigense]
MMKKLFLLMFGLVQTLLFSQTQNLATLATGKYLGLKSILDNDKNLFGYFALYDLGKTENNKKKNKLEYIIFDKNLNSLSTGNFESDETAIEYYSYINPEKQLVITPSFNAYDYAFDTSFYTPSDFIISLNDYQIKKKDNLQYDGTNLTPVSVSKTNGERKDDNRNLKKTAGYQLTSEVIGLNNNHTLIFEYKYDRPLFKDISLKFFNDKNEKVWDYKFFDQDNKYNSVNFKVVNFDNDILIAKVYKYQKDSVEYNFMVFDLKTGKVISVLPFPYERNLYITLNSVDGAINGKYNTNDKLTSLLRYSGGPLNFYNEGFVKLIYDKSTSQLSFNEIHLLDDVYSSHKDIEELKEPFDSKDIDIKSVSFLKNNDIVAIFQKISRKNNAVSDIIMMQFDPMMKLKNLKVYPTQKNSSYLFSQYLNDKNDMVFFYADTERKNREKKWNLFINTFINGQWKQEVLPMTSENNITIPYMAKEGYILLQEFNEKEKFNKIRLERLNY